MTTQAEQETIEAFCRELALALRQITGRDVKIKPGELPVPLKEIETETTEETASIERPGDQEGNELESPDT